MLYIQKLARGVRRGGVLGPLCNARGLTVIEITIALATLALVVLLATPTLARSWDSEQLRGAVVTFTGTHARARAVAVQRSSLVVLDIAGGRLVIRSAHPVTGVTDTVGPVIDLAEEFGLQVTTSRDSLVFDPRGIGSEASTTEIVLWNSAAADTLRISRAGTFYP